MRRFVTAVLVAAVVIATSGILLAGDVPSPAPAAQQQATDPLVRVLEAKGVLSTQEAQAIAAVPLAQQRDQLTAILLKKGVISKSDLQGASTSPNTQLVGFSSSATYRPAVMVETSVATPAPAPQAAPPKPPPIIPAAAPVRVLPIDSPKVGGLIPALKLGPVGIRPYGFFRMSVPYDSSSPYGNDFPLQGFIGTDSGPNKSPEFHIKARQWRFGTNFEWPDISNKLALTGKIEFDFEGNFTRVANRNVSSLRSSQISLRLAWMRMDYHSNPDTSFFAEFGQDWSLFGSSVVDSEVESTIFSVGFGNLYEREAQVKVGAFHKLGGSRNFAIAPEFAVAVPATGLVPGGTDGLSNELAYGERLGVDSAKPTLESRLVFQFQADKAKGVAPAQLVVSGMWGKMNALVTRTAIQGLTASPTATLVKANYPNGTTAESTRWGWQGAFSIPTRYATFISSYYRGGNLRWFFADQLNSAFNSIPVGTAGVVTLADIDAAYTVAFLPTGFLAPVRPVRGQGGFADIVLPLSRIAHANPEGRNAGWTMVFHYGYDSSFARDVRAKSLTRAGGGAISDKGVWNIQYKMNPFVTFAVEESYSRTRSVAGANGVLPSFNEGLPSHQWHDFRSEFFTTFTF